MHDVVSFLIRRFLLALCAIFFVATATFFLMKSIPGDPFAEEMQMSTRESMQAIRKHYGLDDPLYEQYIRYIKQIFSLDFGTSLKNKSQNPYHLAVTPQFHWTDQKIKIHYLICILGYLLATLIWHDARKIGWKKCLMCNKH